MLIILVVVGFALILWELYGIRKAVSAVLREQATTRARLADADRRLSKRAYETSHLLVDLEERVFDVHWAVVPLEGRRGEHAAELRTVIDEERQGRVRWIEDAAEVLPDDEVLR